MATAATVNRSGFQAYFEDFEVQAKGPDFWRPFTVGFLASMGLFTAR